MSLSTSQEHTHLPNSFAFCLLSFIVPASQVPALEISAASSAVANFTCLGYFKFLSTSNCFWILYLWQNVPIITPQTFPNQEFSFCFLLAPPGPIPICWGWGCSSETLLSYFSSLLLSLRFWEHKKVCQRKEILLLQTRRKNNLSLFLSAALPVRKYQSNISICCCQFSLPGLNSPILP